MYVNSFDLVSDKVIAGFQCTDPCFMSAVVVVENYCVCKLSIVLLSDMRVIMPWISSNPFDKGFENRDAASTSGYHVTKNTCRREVWTPGNLRNSFKSVVKLHISTLCQTWHAGVWDMYIVELHMAIESQIQPGSNKT